MDKWGHDDDLDGSRSDDDDGSGQPPAAKLLQRHRSLSLIGHKFCFSDLDGMIGPDSNGASGTRLAAGI